MIVRSGGRDVELRSSVLDDWPYPIPPPDYLVGGGLLGVGAVSIGRAMGLPALLGVLLRLGQGAGMVPLKVYRGEAPTREVAGDSWQYELLHNRPNMEGPPFAFYGDLATAIGSAGYGCVRKYKSRGRVAELIVLDSTKVTPKRQGGRLVFEDRSEGSSAVTRDQREVIYVRGLALAGSPVGLSPIAAARIGILTGLKRQMFEARYFDNNAEARVALSFPERMDHATAKRWVDLWESEHQGPENWHRTGAIGGGAQVTHLPVSMADAQFVEANRMTGEQVGGIYGMPKSFLNIGDNSPTPEDWRFFVTFGLGWILTTIAQTFTADRDLFPLEPNPAQRMMSEHVVDALLKPDIKTRYEAYKAARQAGWLTANEIRALENKPPHPDGDDLQATPVGGAPNPEAAQALLAELEQYAVEAVTGQERLIVQRAIERGRAQMGLD